MKPHYHCFAGGTPEILGALRQRRFVDLTHAFDPSIPHCESFPPEERVTLYHYDEGVGARGRGFLAHEYRLVGQWGTHVDPPAHFVRGGATLDAIPVTEMIAPLVVLDIADRVVSDSDAVVRLTDVDAWERRHGTISGGSFVALRTGWGLRWPDRVRMANRSADGVAHFPGWSAEVLRFLVERRSVVAIGHDTTDTDPGLVVSRREAPLEDYWLRQGKWQIELLANLEQVPEDGAIMIAAWPKPKNGSGFPARCFALV